MDGMDGKLDLPSNGGKWNSFYYRTHAGMDYVHAFDKVDMNITGKFNQSNFNSCPVPSPASRNLFRATYILG